MRLIEIDNTEEVAISVARMPVEFSFAVIEQAVYIVKHKGITYQIRRKMADPFLSFLGHPCFVRDYEATDIESLEEVILRIK